MPNLFPKKFLENKKIRLSPSKEIEPQEIFLDNLAKKREEELNISEKKFETPLSRTIVRGFYLCFLILISIFFLQTFYFQVVRGDDFYLLSQNNKLRTILVRSERGVIYDNKGQQLVFNRPSFDLVCDKRDFPFETEKKSDILSKLSQILDKNTEELIKQIEESELPEVLIAENLDLNQDTLILLQTNPLFSGKGESSVCRVEMNTIRDYVSGENFSHLIGYVGKINKEEIKNLTNYSIADYIGKVGLEKSYESVFRGNPGKWEIEKNTLGEIQSENLASEPEDGNSIVLWLNSDLQKKIEEGLNSMIKNSGAKAGVGVAINPKTGGILALVSLPNFDNNIFSRGTDAKALQEIFNDSSHPLFNRVIAGEYAIGSTIKPLIASAVLQEKLIDPRKQIYDQGFIEIPHQYDPEISYKYFDWTPHGWVDIRKAIAISCNVYFYTVGGGYKDQEGLGPARIKKYLSLFGWGQSNGIDLPNESTGFIPDPAWKKETLGEGWYDGNTYHLSIGQGYIRATPLQVAASFAAIANGGKLLKPKVVQKIIDSQSNTIEEFGPEIIRENFIDPENLQIIREGMRGAVTYGSSVTLNSLPVKAAAKTGTAETGKENHYHNWITVFAPYEDPEIVLTIMIESVKEQMVVAQPVAKEVLNWYFTPTP